MIRRLHLFLIAFLVVSCSGSSDESELSPKGTEKEATEQKTQTSKNKNLLNDGWLIYRIPKGKHRNELKSFGFFTGDTLAFRFYFDSTVVYQTEDSANQADWNKLFGFSDCGSYHQKNSIRLGWRYAPKKGVEIGEYRYADGERHFSTIGTTSVGDTNFARIVVAEASYLIDFNGKSFQFARKCAGNFGRYWLYPYFGGDETAPRDVNIHILHLKPAKD